MRPETKKYLFDVGTACEAMLNFIGGKGFSDYEADLMLRSAVERQLMIVGEALNRANRVDPEIAELIPEIRDIIQLRNIIAHGYTIVENATVWGILQADVPKLYEQVKAILAGQ
jgi:uncharacterized protein with HEPN domain